MQYKILLIKNRYTDLINIKTYLDWFKLNAPIEIVMDEINTDFDVTTQTVSNATFSGVICGADILAKVRTVVPENKYNAVVFLYGNNLNGIRVSSTNIDGTQPLYPDTEFIQTFRGDDSGKTINHELFHGFFAKARKCQINIVDPMDTYLRDGDLIVDSIINTNREQSLQLLKPYWNKICEFRNIPIFQNPISTWKYFTPGEFTNTQKTHTVSELKTDLVDKLDLIRGDCRFPFKINSGYRTSVENNNLPESVTDSAHTTKEAVDIVCLDSEKRQKIHDIARKYGITRIGLGKNFVHLDISKTLPQNVTWLY